MITPMLLDDDLTEDELAQAAAEQRAVKAEHQRVTRVMSAVNMLRISRGMRRLPRSEFTRQLDQWESDLAFMRVLGRAA